VSRGSASTLAEVIFQRLERAVPVARQRGQELLRHLHRRRAQPVPHPAPLTRLGRHQARLGQQRQVLGDRLPGDRQSAGQVCGGGGPSRGQGGQDGAPARVGQGDEDLLGDRLDVKPGGLAGWVPRFW
jgi:hypothetical protein